MITQDEIRTIIVENIYCEDNKIYLRNKIKYDLYNLLCDRDIEFIEELHKRLEYNPNKEE